MANAVTNVDRYRDSHHALYRLVQGQGSSRAALIAAALFAAMPMTLYYGGLPEVVGMPLVLFALISVRRTLVPQWTGSVEGTVADRRVHSGCCERLACLHPSSRLLSALSRNT